MPLRRLVVGALRPILPAYIGRQVEFEVKIALRHFLYSHRTRRRLQKLQGCRVNIGCGPYPAPGWVNIDVLPFPNVHYWDCRRGLPFSDGAVTAIYSEHSFEHLDLDAEAKPYLQECLRCLRPGGVLRLVVPDAAHTSALTVNHGKNLRPCGRLSEQKMAGKTIGAATFIRRRWSSSTLFFDKTTNTNMHTMKRL